MVEHNLYIEWLEPTHIRMSKGRSTDIIPLMESRGLSAPLIVTDKALTSSQFIKKLLRKIDKTSYPFGIFSEIENFVTLPQLELGKKLLEKGRFDSLIAIGSHAAIDCAKLIAHQKNLPVIALPVTSITGAEVIARAYYQDFNDNLPVIRYKDVRRPELVIYDVGIITSIEANLSIDFPMFILSQAIEAWCAEGFDPVNDTLSAEAIRLIFIYAPKLRTEPDNLQAQYYIISANIMAALSATKGQGATIALARTLKLLHKTPLGISAGLLLPHVITCNSNELNPRILLLAEKLGIKDGTTGFIKALLQLRRHSKIPGKLGTLMKDIKLEQKEKLLIEQSATEDPAAKIAPTRLTQKAVLKILNSACTGKIHRR